MCLFLPRPERNSSDYVKLNNTSLLCYYRNHETEIRTSHLSGLLSNWAMPCQWFCQEMNCILPWIIILILITWLIKKSHCALASQSGSKFLLKKKNNNSFSGWWEKSRWLGIVAKGSSRVDPGLGFVSLSPHVPPGKPSCLARSCRLHFCVRMTYAFVIQIAPVPCLWTRALVIWWPPLSWICDTGHTVLVPWHSSWSKDLRLWVFSWNSSFRGWKINQQHLQYTHMNLHLRNENSILRTM